MAKLLGFRRAEFRFRRKKKVSLLKKIAGQAAVGLGAASVGAAAYRVGKRANMNSLALPSVKAVPRLNPGVTRIFPTAVNTKTVGAKMLVAPPAATRPLLPQAQRKGKATALKARVANAARRTGKVLNSDIGDLARGRTSKTNNSFRVVRKPKKSARARKLQGSNSRTIVTPAPRERPLLSPAITPTRIYPVPINNRSPIAGYLPPARR